MQNNFLKFIVSHIGYTSDNLEKSVEFYRNIMGFNKIHTQLSDQDYLSAVTGFKDCRLRVCFTTPDMDRKPPLEIIEYLNPKGETIDNRIGQIGSNYLCWKVTNLNYFYKRILKAGLKILWKPTKIDYGLWSDANSMLFKAPDGLFILLLEENFTESVPEVKEIHHVTYIIKNINVMINFLCKQLGFKLIHRIKTDCDYLKELMKLDDGPIEVVYIAIPETKIFIQLWSFKSNSIIHKNILSNTIGSIHICYRVNDISNAYRILTKEGVKFVGPPADITAGINKGSKAIYIRGPECITSELSSGIQTKI